MNFSLPTLFALFLILLVAGSFFAILIFHMLDHYFCPLNGSDFCTSIEKLLVHLTYLKISFLSLFPVFFALLLAFASYLLREEEQLKEFPRHFYSQPKNLNEPSQPFLRWLAIHTNSPTYF